MSKLLTPHYSKGLFLEELNLWMDPEGSKDFAFVSHAHADHFARHQRILCSENTAALVAARFGTDPEAITALPYEEPYKLNGHTLQLLPAGHIFGSAMLHITRDEDGATLLYTGDFKMRTGRTAEPVQLLQADTLIMETTFGLPRYIFPSQDEIDAGITQFVRAALDDGDVPVLLGYSLGKAQEAIALMAESDIPCVLQKNVFEMTAASRLAGCKLPEPILHDGGPIPSGHVYVAPPHSVRSHMIRKMKNTRLAMLSGWALNPSSIFRYRTDAVLPLSDHADHPGLWEAVKLVQPKQVLTLHGYAREFASELRSHGIDAWSVFGSDQLELSIAAEEAQRDPHTHARPECSFASFTGLCQSIGTSPGRLDKVSHVAAYLQKLDGESLEVVTQWLTGKPFSRHQSDGSLNVGSATVRQAILAATGCSLVHYKQVSSTQADASRTARLIMEESQVSPEPWELLNIQEFFKSLRSASGSLVKVDALADMFQKLHPWETGTLVSLLTGDLRIGLKEALVEDGLAKAFDVAPQRIRTAHTLSGALGKVALQAMQGRLDEAQLTGHVALKPMLASPEETEEAIWDRLGTEENEVWLEDKFDGIRAQIHWADGRASLWSRDRRTLDSEFPEVLASASEFSDSVIFDGEIIAFAEGKKLTFFDLQKRLGRKTNQGDLFRGAAVPVRFVIFDLLWKNGKSYLDKPLTERRQALESLALPTGFELIQKMDARSPTEMNELFQASRKRGNEGLIAKDPNSYYSPGRRGKSWLKLKKIGATLDCVVIKAQQGHGKRAEVLSDYTFAVKDERSGELKTLGKAYSGLTDQEIEELTEHFRATTLSRARRIHEVEPTIVLEIAFDSIQPSKRHNSGLSLRFPRIKAIRRDKSVADIDTLAYAQRLAGAED